MSGPIRTEASNRAGRHAPRPGRRGLRAARGSGVASLLLLVAVPAFPQQIATGSVGGRVVDAGTGLPVSGVLVEVAGVPPVLTDREGIFLIRDAVAGARPLTLQHLAYGTHTEAVVIPAGGELAIELSISTQAIELAPLVVETLSELDRRRVSSGHSMNEIVEEEIDLAAQAGLTVGQLIQQSMPGVLVRQGPGGQTCVSYRAVRTNARRNLCDGVSVLLDGVPVSAPGYLLSALSLRDLARLEMMSPGQAGVSHGMMAGQGVLLIETKRGEDRTQNDISRLRTGFDWSAEPEPYRWQRVLVGSLVANALGAGIGLALADRCFWTPETTAFALRTKCRGLGTLGAGTLSIALPALGGGLTARWGGQTSRSQGRLIPSVVTASMVLTGGYLMMIGGDDTVRGVGIAVVAVGTPLSMTLSDRIFRILR